MCVIMRKREKEKKKIKFGILLMGFQLDQKINVIKPSTSGIKKIKKKREKSKNLVQNERVMGKWGRRNSRDPLFR